MSKRVQVIILLLLAAFLLSGCDQVEDLSQQADVSRIENAEFFANLQETVALFRIPVLFIGLINLFGGWKFGRFGLMINGFVIGGLMLYTYLKHTDYVTDENTLMAMGVVGGIIIGIVTYFAYNLMALIIGGVIGTTLMSGTWLQITEDIPPQILVFVTTFVSAMLMFLVFRLFMVAFSAVIGAALMMLAVPYETLWVIPVAGIGILVQSGIALWIHDDIFANLRGDMGAAVGEAFGEVLGPFGILRERTRGEAPADEPRQRAPRGGQAAQVDQYAPPPQQQRYNQPSPQQPYQAQQPYQPEPPRYSPPPQQQPYQPPAAPQQPRYNPPPAAPQYNPPPQQPYQPPASPQVDPASHMQTQQRIPFRPETMQIALSDGRTFALTPGSQITAGRNATNGIAVNDPQVSGNHMTISIQPDGIVIWDNGSTNGTFVNGQPLQGSHRLTTNDIVQIGDTRLYLVKKSGA